LTIVRSRPILRAQMASARANVTRFMLRTVLRPWLCAGPLEQQRRRFAALAPRRLPSRLRLERVSLGAIAGEWVTPTNARQERVIYYLHGGGFIVCSPATHRMIAGNLARAADARALLIDYRLAPEHPFPASLEDSLAGYRWLLASGIRPEHVIVAGDSAGGALALGVLIALRDKGEPLPAAAVCLSPATDATQSGASFTERARDEAFLTQGFCRQALAMYLDGQDPRTPLASPLYADLHGLPPILIHVGTHELLLDDSTRFADKARAAGVDVTLKIWDGMWHVFQGFAGVPEAGQSNAEIGAFMKAHFGKAYFRPSRPTAASAT
jgi:monoterpene epsilon-lactone hydrolase